MPWMCILIFCIVITIIHWFLSFLGAHHNPNPFKGLRYCMSWSFDDVSIWNSAMSPVIKKDKQHNGQRKNDKRSNNDLQNTTQKTKDRVTRTPLKTGGWTAIVLSVLLLFTDFDYLFCIFKFFIFSAGFFPHFWIIYMTECSDWLSFYEYEYNAWLGFLSDSTADHLFSMVSSTPFHELTTYIVIYSYCIVRCLQT
jgi:hypothetical protein